MKLQILLNLGLQRRQFHVVGSNNYSITVYDNSNIHYLYGWTLLFVLSADFHSWRFVFFFTFAVIFFSGNFWGPYLRCVPSEMRWDCSARYLEAVLQRRNFLFLFGESHQQRETLGFGMRNYLGRFFLLLVTVTIT